MSSRRLLPLFFLLCLLPLLAPAVRAEEVTEETADLSFLSPNLAVPDDVRPEALDPYRRGDFLLSSYRRGQAYWGETEEEAGHGHVAAVNAKGDGRTDVVDGHFHRIEKGVPGPALRAGTGQPVEGEGAHTHAMKALETKANLTASEPMTAQSLRFPFGPIRADHFNYVLGLTDKGHGDHYHVVNLHFFGNGLSGKAANHGHLFRGYQDKGAIKGIRGRKAIRADNFHQHEAVRWCFRKFWFAEAGQYMVDQFEQATRKDSDFALAYYKMAILYQWLREFDLARKAIDKAVRGLPDFHEAFVERGDVFSWMMEHDKAFLDYRRALRIRPDYAHTHYCMAMTHLRMARHAEAREDFAAAAEGLAKELERLKALAEDHPDSLALKEKTREVENEKKSAENYVEQLDKEKGWPSCWKDAKVYRCETDHYVVRTTMCQEVADFFGERLELAYDLFTRKFQLQRPNKIKIRVYLFPDRKEYLKTGAPPQSGGYSSPLLQKIVFPVNGKDIAKNGFNPAMKPTAESTVETRNVLVHEAFHQFLDKYLEMAPQNFNEGCADYFAPSEYNLKTQGRRQVPELIIKTNSWRLKSVQQMLKTGAYVPLVPFLRQTKAEMYDRQYMGLHYAQAWGFFYFLWEYKVNRRRKYWDVLNRYYQALRKGKGLNRAFDEAFGRVNMDRLEKEWKDFIQGLK